MISQRLLLPIIYHLIVFLKGLLCFFFIATISSLQAQNYYSFTKLSMEDGLVDDWVTSALLDQDGYLWLTTLNGLSRYEGNNFQNFKSNQSDTTSIGGNTVMDIIEDQTGTIWVATMGVSGLNRYDKITETFQRILYPENPLDIGQAPVDLYQDVYDEDILWIGTYSSGLIQYNKKKKVFIGYDIDNSVKNPFTFNSVLSIQQDKLHKNKLWLGTNNGLCVFDKNTSEFILQPYPSFIAEDIHLSILSILPEGDDVIWLGTNSYGLVKFEISKKRWNFISLDKKLTSINQKRTAINKIALGPENKLWLCSESHGLMLFDKELQSATIVKSNNSNSEDNEVTGMYIDRFQRYWFFNKLKGVSMLDFNNQKFAFTPLTNIPLCYDNQLLQATDFSWDKKRKQLYVTTADCYGLHIFDSSGKLKEKILINNLVGENNKEIFLLNDSENNLWLAGKGLVVFNHEIKKIEPKFENTIVSDSQIRGIIQSQDGFVWLITRFNGLLKLNLEKETIQQYLKNEQFPNAPNTTATLFDILEDKKQNIWLATHKDGVFKLDRQQNQFTNYGIPEFEPLTLTEDKDGMIWVGGFSQGIRIINPDLNSEQKYTSLKTEDGLVSNQITQLAKDDKGIWINTRFGLNWYDEEQKQFVAFGKRDGIKEPYQNPFAIQKGFKVISNGNLLIGEKNGFYTTNTVRIRKKETPVKVVFTNFEVFNKKRHFEKNLNLLSKIELNHDENFFSAEFAALDLSNPTKNQFSYKLEGLNKDWVFLGNKNIAYFTDVRPGKYILKVKATNSDGIWNKEYVQLEIKISPPWWATIWAYLIYALLALGTIYGVYQFQLRRKLAMMEAKRLQEIDVLKTRLYNNITHEFRTPLTVILGMANELSKRVGARNKKSLEMIERNGKSLLSLINQVLDLSKIESGQVSLEMIQGDVISFIRYLTESFQSYVASKNITLTFYSELSEVIMDYDPKRLQSIISNLLSNAIKFTEENGKIILHISNQVNELKSDDLPELVIHIKDSGIGIEEENIQFLFDRFYQVNNTSTRKAEGTGIGLALTKELIELMNGQITVKSRVGKGTKFTVRLPITQEAVKKITNEEHAFFQNKENESQNRAVITDTNSSNPSELPQLLIIEDNVDVLDYIKICIKNDFHISEATNGKTGIEKALEIIPDIIISDVMMPEKDGFEVTDFLKNDDRTSHIPIILLTGKADNQSKLEGLKRGADAYLTKPFNKEELNIRLKKLVEIRQRLLERYSQSSIDKIEPSTKVHFQIEDAFLKKLKEIVEKHIDNPDFNITQFCKEAGMSRAQLHRKLKALTNKSATIFIRSIRLRKAKVLLETTDLNISEVAYEVGFSNPSYFSTSFLEEFNITPSETRS